VSDRTYRDSDFADPVATCDIIMKGGITSGVVYSLAIAELAKHYRFANIGGTSAGAIAAAAAAAAEYGRRVPGKGFMRLVGLPDESGKILFGLFQPTRTLAPLFDMLVATLKAKGRLSRYIALGWAAVWGFRRSALLGTLIAIVTGLTLWRYAGIGGVAFTVLLALIGLGVGVTLALRRAVTKHLPENHYGLCSGIRQPGFRGDGFTDWLADLIDETAGRDPKQHDPLTFGDLAAPDGNRPPIALRMMTTNLMRRRPYSLPFQDQTYTFKREDFEKIFPLRIMRYLLRESERFLPKAGEQGEYYKFPPAEKLPVVVAVRMSLSVPLLISAVPLYARDWTLRPEHRDELQRCLFSDGGLSSNFPIHFFDNMLPNTPTFGISLDEYDVRRDRGANRAAEAAGAEEPAANGRHETRVWMPETGHAGSGLLLPIEPFDGLPGFLARLLYAAKDWQDNLQSTLTGYRDRIVHVYLKSDEGGLNVVMPPDLVGALGEYGAQAGAMLRDAFSLDEHRWRRFLVAMDRLGKTLENFLEAYDGRPGGSEPFGAFLARYPQHARGFKQTVEDLALLRARAGDLAKLAREWGTQHGVPEDKLPHPETDLRITPKP
jgi:predicted acylesterase/phospholipase RssA